MSLRDHEDSFARWVDEQRAYADGLITAAEATGVPAGSSSRAAHGWAVLAEELERLMREARAERAQFTAERKNWPMKQFYNGMEHAMVELQSRIERKMKAPPNHISP